MRTKSVEERPFGTLCVLHFENFSQEKNGDIYLVAAAIEMLILSLDIVDDLQDQDSQEIWMKNPSHSLNTVLYMLHKCMLVILKTSFKHKHQALEIICKYVMRSINGQQLDLQNEGKKEEVYLKMIEDKSGSLTTLSCLTGKVLADGHIDDHCISYSMALGAIQQMNNDMHCLKTWDEKNDFLNGRFSLPILYILNKYSFFTEYLIDVYKCKGKLFIPYSNPVDIFNNSLAFQYSNIVKKNYQNKAKQALEMVSLPKSTKEYILKYLK
ncbi:polyprenyl synthetase family protein [Rummeliibacillus suwonensis]|uniref:polyprenyl synthetase family protein n=1 Tax=Rummeliibacillus suwonensis TaxID=1306154 RepID=UPI001AAEBD69|nr:polyprenyl synthetase family protein [Rummeliibacillus suwonensis]